MEQKWYEKAFRRNVVDMHITDCDERFMSQFDPKTYVDMLTLSQVQSAVIYAHSHYGLCFFPTKVSTMHPGLKGRNVLKELIELCHERGIYAIVYCSAIYDTMAYRNNPDWKIRDANGNPVADNSRYGICCPNSPYREYFLKLTSEIVQNFDLDGIRIDMTFWPAVCYCRHCQQRFAEEVGKELPTKVNWADPAWVSFQRKREEWLIEFADDVTKNVKGIKPFITVEHQASTYHAGWTLGVTYGLADKNDFLQGDFYGDALQGSFVRKLFYNLSPNHPCAFETSVGIDLSNYTTLKPKELLKAKAFASLADSCAFVFIDSIDPTGIMNPTVYRMMGEIFNETKDYEPYLGGELCQDVGVYVSTESKFDFEGAGTPHIDCAIGACKALIDDNIPFGVITKKNINDLEIHKVVILPNVLMVDVDEVNAFRNYVQRGGCIYASKNTSLITKDGTKHDNFLLSDVFGVSYTGETSEKFTFIAPMEGYEELFSHYSVRFPIGFPTSQILIQPNSNAKQIGRLVLPHFSPWDPIKFASIHNNPPGKVTNYPALTLNQFGQGMVIYSTIELEKFDTARDLFIRLIRSFKKQFTFESDAPKAVEITVFHQEDKGRFIINLINFQKELPNIPVEGIEVRLKLKDKKPRKLTLIPQEIEIDYRYENGYVCFRTPKFETFCMVAVYYL